MHFQNHQIPRNKVESRVKANGSLVANLFSQGMGLALACNLFFYLVYTGCSDSSSGRVEVPRVSEDIPGSLIAEFDKDSDGSISKDELPKGMDLQGQDKDSDGKFSKPELEALVRNWQDMQVGMTAFRLQLTRNGTPLEGAIVTLEPYSFLGSETLPASGISGPDGVVQFSVAEDKTPSPGLKVMHTGFFKMRVSKEEGGKESIPAKYNSESVLGCAVLPSLRPVEKIDL